MIPTPHSMKQMLRQAENLTLNRRDYPPFPVCLNPANTQLDSSEADKWLPDKWPPVPGPGDLKEGDVSLGALLRCRETNPTAIGDFALAPGRRGKAPVCGNHLDLHQQNRKWSGYLMNLATNDLGIEA
ncbi:Chromosome-associated kinesin KIF4A [Manis javanica]|nr:Chromosome-associated kinesin KIF4A [Manis javanica]